MNCNAIRDMIALDPTSEEAIVLEHLGGCEDCTSYRRQHQSLDVVLRAEMRWEAPAALTAQLLAIVAAPSLQAAPLRPAPARPRGWYVGAVYALTAVVIGLSLLVAWQLVGLLTAQVGLDAALTQVFALPAQGMKYLTETLPESRYAIDFLSKVRDQLMWLLLIAVLWAALDKWNIPFNLGRSRQTS